MVVRVQSELLRSLRRFVLQIEFAGWMSGVLNVAQLGSMRVQATYLIGALLLKISRFRRIPTVSGEVQSCIFSLNSSIDAALAG